MVAPRVLCSGACRPWGGDGITAAHGVSSWVRRGSDGSFVRNATFHTEGQNWFDPLGFVASWKSRSGQAGPGRLGFLMNGWGSLSVSQKWSHVNHLGHTLGWRWSPWLKVSP